MSNSTTSPDNYQQLDLFSAEVWRPVPGYEGLYEVSNTGLVKRLAGSPKCWKNRILHPGRRTNGYLFVVLSKRAVVSQFDIHRLVAWAFIGPQGDMWVNHKNGDKTDNCLGNLEYLTPGENAQHAYDTGLQPSRKGEGNGQAKLTDETVRQIRALSAAGVPRKEIVKLVGRSRTAVRDVIVGKSWSHLL